MIEYLEGQAAAAKVPEPEEPETETDKALSMETIRYSQLVERYLKTHKYECFNIVKPWKFKTTDRTDIHRKDLDKFSMFVQSAKEIETKNVKGNEELKGKIGEEKKKMRQVVYYFC